LEVPLTLTTYITRVETLYSLVTRYWVRLPDGTRVLKREVTRFLAPEEVEELRESEERLEGRVQEPTAEEVPRYTPLRVRG